MLALLAKIAAAIGAFVTAAATKVVTVAKTAVAAAKVYVTTTAPAKIVSDAVKVAAVVTPIAIVAKVTAGKAKIAKMTKNVSKKLAPETSPFDRAMSVNKSESAIGYNNEAEEISDSIMKEINKPFKKNLYKNKKKGVKKGKKRSKGSSTAPKTEAEWRDLRLKLNKMMSDPNCQLAQDVLKEEYLRKHGDLRHFMNRRFAWYDDEIDDTNFKGIDFEEILDLDDQVLTTLINNDGSWEIMADEDGFPCGLSHEQVDKYARDREEMTEVCQNYPNLEAGGFWDDDFGRYWNTSTYLVDILHNPVMFPG